MNDDILDSEELDVSMSERTVASKGLRFVNYLIDGMIIGTPLSFLSTFMLTGEIFVQSGGFDFRIYLINYVLITTYYIIIESVTGKTIGKMITGTKVVNHQGNKPSSNQIVGRSLARLIPFEALSFLGASGIGWHDSLSKTYVVMGK